MKRFSSLILVVASAALFTACANDTATTPVPSTTPTPVMSPLPTSTPIALMRSVTGTQTVNNKDGSTTVVTNYSDGSKSENRTFKAGRLSRVTRETQASGARTVRVTYRADASEVDVDDPNWAEKAMDATGDALATAAGKTKQGVKKGINETGDKAEDVGDAVKKGARKTADKAEDVGDAVKKGAKKAGSKIKDAVTPDKKND